MLVISGNRVPDSPSETTNRARARSNASHADLCYLNTSSLALLMASVKRLKSALQTPVVPRECAIRALHLQRLPSVPCEGRIEASVGAPPTSDRNDGTLLLRRCEPPREALHAPQPICGRTYPFLVCLPSTPMIGCLPGKSGVLASLRVKGERDLRAMVSLP